MDIVEPTPKRQKVDSFENAYKTRLSDRYTEMPYTKKRSYRKGSSKKMLPGITTIGGLERMLQQRDIYSQQRTRAREGRSQFLRGTNESIARYGLTAKLASPGQLTQRAMDKFKGNGMYGATETASNALVRGSANYDTIPTFTNLGEEDGAIEIVHREYISDINGPAKAFVTSRYSINPGLPESFPYLSQIAANFEEYEIKQLVYMFRSTINDISTTGQCGTVMLTTQYNAGAQEFSDKVSMLEYCDAESAKTTTNQIHGVECDPAKLPGDGQKYVRTGPVPEGQEIKTYDWGVFNLGVANSPVQYLNAGLGELWCSYRVILRKPKFYVNKGYSIRRDIFMQPSPDNMLTPLSPLQSTGQSGYPGLLYGQQNNIGCTIEMDTAPKIYANSNPSTNIVANPWDLFFENKAPSTTIIFPDDFQGNVEIRLTMSNVNGKNIFPVMPQWQGNGGTAAAGTMQMITSYGLPLTSQIGLAPPVLYQSLNGTETMRPVYDILGGNLYSILPGVPSGNVWTPYFSASDDPTCNVQTGINLTGTAVVGDVSSQFGHNYIYIHHLQLKATSVSGANRLTLQWNSNVTQNYDTGHNCLEINAYNPQFNYKEEWQLAPTRAGPCVNTALPAGTQVVGMLEDYGGSTPVANDTPVLVNAQNQVVALQ
jgi:hypothetical protein